MNTIYDVEVLKKKMNIVEKALNIFGPDKYDPTNANILSDILNELKILNSSISEMNSKLNNINSLTRIETVSEKIETPKINRNLPEFSDKQYIPDINIDSSKSEITSKKKIVEADMSAHMEALNRLK